jgi:cytochrome oxidase Cu insertion factor (SCO1/SenC/PrrC family)
MAAQDEPLGLTVHTMPTPGPQDLRRRTVSGRIKMLLVLLACAAPVLASYFTYYVIRPEGRSNYGTLVQPSRTMPASLTLRNLEGQPVETSSLRNQWLLVVVGTGACDEACMQRLYMQRQLRQMVGRERDRLDKVWLIVDEAPLPAELKAYLTGPEPVQVLRVPQAELAAWLQPASGQTLQDHLYVVDPMGEWMMRFPPQPEPAKVKRDLERLLRASSFWDPAGR